MKKITRIQSLESCLVLATVSILIYFLKSADVFLYIALGVGITGILIRPLADRIAYGWLKLGEVLGFIVPKLVLGIIFYFFLFPVSLLYRLSKKDKLQIRHPGTSAWTERDHQYNSKDLEEIW